jgi:hypothetical protein
VCLLEPVDFEGRESPSGSVGRRSRPFEKEQEKLRWCHEWRGDLDVVGPRVKVAAQLAYIVVVARKVQVQPQERDAHTLWKADLEVIGEQVKFAAPFPHSDAEVEPCVVATLEVWEAATRS